ncbi:MAG: phage holin family protein [Cellulomonas sp.]|uniref:phage holin family protein n=1 Tax=Cellulomonas sp. TaxID=40001 RepID=UPI0019F59ABC|nr:phage holin family protein [Cellulomonas sp.]MBF0686190.1 phage holin family protein [Cellulomonas sp.]
MTGPGDPTVAAGLRGAPGAAPPPGVVPPAGAVPPPSGTPVGATGADADDRPSLGDLIGNVTQDLSLLVRQEVELAKAELSQTAKRAGKGSGLLAGAGVAGYFVLLFLSCALWWGLPMGRAWAAVVVAAIWAIIAAVMAQRGRGEMKRVKGMPRTAETVKKIPNALKGDEEANHE